MSEEEEVQVIAGEDSEEEEEEEIEETTTTAIATNPVVAMVIDEGKNVDGEDDEEEEEPQEIEGEDDEDEEEDEDEEQPATSSLSVTTTINTTTTATNTAQKPAGSSTTLTVESTNQSVSHIRTPSNASNVSEGTTTNTSITTNPQISDTNSESATPVTPVASQGAALVEGATRKLSTFWKSFKSNVATVVTTTNQAITSTSNTPPQQASTTTSQVSSTTSETTSTTTSTTVAVEKTSETIVNNEPSEEPPKTPPHNHSQPASGSPSYSTYFSGVLNKLKSELQTSTLAEPVEKLKKALTGEPANDPKNPNQIVLKVTHRMKDLKHANEQMEQTIHNKYSNTLEHINVELMRLNNGMTRTLQSMQQTQLQLKKSSENLSNLLTALESCQQPIENKEGTN